MMSDSIPFSTSFLKATFDGEICAAAVSRDQLTDEDNLEQFTQDLNLLIEKHEVRNLILQLSQVRYMTSSAIGKLIALHRKVNRSGGRMVLCELTPEVSEALSASRLLEYFSVEPDLDLAILALQAT